MMDVLAIGQLTGKDIGPHLEAEGRHVAKLRREGLVRDVFLKADRTGPILLLSDVDAADAARRLATLPFIAHDLVKFRVRRTRVASIRPGPRCNPPTEVSEL
jgi:hypothetical protein